MDENSDKIEERDTVANQVNVLVMREFANGMTVKELKALIKDWPEVNEYTGEDCEVWVETGVNKSSPVTLVMPLNKRTDDDGNESADICMETNAFDA